MKHLKEHYLTCISIMFLILVYQILAIIIDKQNIFPDFLSIVFNLFNLLKTLNTYESIFWTVAKTFLSLIIAFTFAILLSFLSFRYNKFYLFIKPYILLFQALPNIILMFILFLIIGNKFNLAIYLINIIVILPLVFQNIYSELKSIDKSIILACNLEEVSKIKKYRLIHFSLIQYKLIYTFIFAFSLGLKVTIMSEILAGSTKVKGIGILIYTAMNVEYKYINIYSITLLILIVLFLIQKLLSVVKKKSEI